jgi:hypothetical protein
MRIYHAKKGIEPPIILFSSSYFTGDIAKKNWSKHDTALCHDVTTSSLIWRSQNIIFRHLSSFQCVIIYALLPNTVKQLLALLVVW